MSSGSIKPFYGPAKQLYNFLINKNYWKYFVLELKLRRIPRFTPCRTKAHGWNLFIPDSASFLSAYREIFAEQIYAFQFDNPAPRILDLGANIGLSVLYFKKLYPLSSITAFEADPDIFAYLKKNVHGNGYNDVQLINKAAWHEDAMLRFHSDGADGGYAAHTGDANSIEVDAINIADFLRNHQFDFLKIDIEGAEEHVLPACKDYLSNIKFVFVEYHSKYEQKQCLDQIINILAGAGFRLHIHSLMTSPSPFVDRKISSGFDLQLNIFAWR
jgi:FkbM family methyltransferase